MELLPPEMILYVNHVISNKKIIFLLSQSYFIRSRHLFRCSESAYNGIYPNSCPSKSTAYTGPRPDGDHSESHLKDGNSPMSDARSQPTMGLTLMAARVSQQLILGPHPEGDHDNTPPKLGVSPSSKIRRYHYGTTSTWQLHAKSSQMLRDQNSSPSRRNKSIAVTNKAKSK